MAPTRIWSWTLEIEGRRFVVEATAIPAEQDWLVRWQCDRPPDAAAVERAARHGSAERTGSRSGRINVYAGRGPS